METVCLRHTELPNTSGLFTDFLYHYHRAERFYTAPPTSGYPESRRAALVAALREQNPNSADALRLLSAPDAVAVVTGQQVGLFSGPAYTVFKALTAARMAANLRAHGRDAVPVFWLATEDHDWPEVDHAWVFDQARNPVRLDVQPDRNGGAPVGTVRVQDWPIAELEKALDGMPFCREVVDLVASTHKPGATMGEAFRALLERILKPYGFLFLDPLRPAIRELAAPVLQQAFDSREHLLDLLLQRSRELEEAGYHAQVHVDGRMSLLFTLQDGRRIPLRDVRQPLDAIDPRNLSPNALLRPVVQDYMLPTAAYVGGPAELAYFAQSQVLYENLLGRMPRVVSRNGYTLLDARTVKLLERYRLRLQDFFGGEEALRERVAASLIPEALQGEFDGAAEEAAALLAKLKTSVRSFDPTLEAALAKSEAKIRHQFSRSRAKVAREILRRETRAAEDTRWLYNALYPQKHLQERLYSILPFLAQHGPELVNRLYDAVQTECPDHVLLPI